MYNIRLTLIIRETQYNLNFITVYRNARSEEKAASDYERRLELKVDAMYAEAEKNFESKKTVESDDEVEHFQVKTNKRQSFSYFVFFSIFFFFFSFIAMIINYLLFSRIYYI
jgi:ABC-type Na+ efflux pump permease subunit